MFEALHDPVPDGKTGPWLRERHAKDEHGFYVFDARCQACQDEQYRFLAGWYDEHLNRDGGEG